MVACFARNSGRHIVFNFLADCYLLWEIQIQQEWFEMYISVYICVCMGELAGKKCGLLLLLFYTRLLFDEIRYDTVVCICFTFLFFLRVSNADMSATVSTLTSLQQFAIDWICCNRWQDTCIHTNHILNHWWLLYMLL